MTEIKTSYTFQLLIAFLLMGSVANAQKLDTVTIRFVPTFNKEVVQLGQSYFLRSLNDSVLFETLKFYVSKPENVVGKTLTHKATPEFRLVDMENPSSMEMQGTLPENSDFNTLQFLLGVDSATNMAGAQGGDLDPTKGMYWSWQSGYINFRLEGKSKSCPARKNVFQYHLGGYQAPFNAAQVVELKNVATKEIVITIALDELLTKVDITKNYEIMSPGEKAMEFAQLLTTVFSIGQ